MYAIIVVLLFLNFFGIEMDAIIIMTKIKNKIISLDYIIANF
jgi:hypothetical protein